MIRLTTVEVYHKLTRSKADKKFTDSFFIADIDWTRFACPKTASKTLVSSPFSIIIKDQKEGMRVLYTAGDSDWLIEVELVLISPDSSRII